MTATLYVVHGSHPCATVEAALRMKGIGYRKVEWPPLMHVPMQRMLFGRRTVPALRIDGEKISGSRDILRRLDEIRPEPALLPADPTARERVLEAERWGDEVLQPIGRRVIWPALIRRPAAAPSFQEGARLPMPAFLARALTPAVARGERRLNGATEEALQADLRMLPSHLDRIDAWIADGTLGGDTPNAADLQIGGSLRLLRTIADVRPLIDARPAARLATAYFDPAPGEIPAGTLPADWIPAVPSPNGTATTAHA